MNVTNVTKKTANKNQRFKKKQIGIWLAILTCKTKVKKKKLNSAWFYHFECY